MAVLLSTARVIKVSALYLFLPFLFPSSVTRELTTVSEYLRNIISWDNTIGPYKKYRLLFSEIIYWSVESLADEMYKWLFISPVQRGINAYAYAAP